MRLKNGLFNEPYLIYQIEESSMEETRDYLEWEITPIHGKTLASENLRFGFSGLFILAGKLLDSNETIQNCYVEISIPERIHEYDYILTNGLIKRVGAVKSEFGRAIPAVGIEKYGVYGLYYLKKRPDIGLSVLEQALKISHHKKDIACDLGYIYRDEKRFDEAIQSFLIALEEVLSEPVNDMTLVYAEFLNIELRQLYKKIGQIEKAKEREKDWALVFKRKYGHEPTENELPW